VKKAYVKFLASPKLRRIGNRLRKRLFHAGLVLLYHRVSEQLLDPQRLCVTPQHFSEHLEVLHKLYSPLSLNQLAHSLRDRKIANGSVVLTFDDGYRDNLLEAKPLMERYPISATVFVTTGYTSGARETWWDGLQRIFLHPGHLPKVLQMSVGKERYRWELGGAADYAETCSNSFAHWNVETNDNPTMRHQIYRTLFSILRPLAEEERQKTLSNLYAWAEVKQEAGVARDMLSHEELARLAKEGLFEIGAHTVTHPILSQLPVAKQRAEIQESKKRLEDIIGRPVASFAYPYGALKDFTSDTVAVVRELGFTHACSNFPGLVFRGTDPFQLPRFLVRDWDGHEFSSRLDCWFRG
jgi:peptidoglycan/xylan/chitin deacetylase (PgdA/CDA1 family)